MVIYLHAQNRHTLWDASDDCLNGDPSWLYVLEPSVNATPQNDEAEGGKAYQLLHMSLHKVRQFQIQKKLFLVNFLKGDAEQW